ncbi:leucine-rich repeat and WD repeat-containing protein 1 isoform X2 [Genypterus blacodes]|uniref:leucine-rich repeat and WD repeat-containing protein 1 isoform X2 n=1 Tax=Genypterus blacodes TaxID=154954 RepID=UPI003F76B713
MVKLTEELLLEKGSPKANKLEQIVTLNLSRLQLKCQDLPVQLLSRLQSLERLDLSGNNLQEFPQSLQLHRLRYLDLSDNQMEDVTTLSSLNSLEELKLEDNIYITVSDNYKVMVLLPNLRIYNGKNISTAANHIRYVYSENLRKRIIMVWEKSFSLPDLITPEKMTALEKKFVSAAREQVKYGPSSIGDFTKWRVEIMASEYLRSLRGEEETEMESKEPIDTKERSVTMSTKRKQAASAFDHSNQKPRKKTCTDVPASPTDQSSCLRLRPQTVKQTDAPRMSPRKRPLPPTTPTRVQTTRTGSKCDGPLPTPSDEVSQKKAKLSGHMNVLPKMTSSNRTSPVCLKPLHVLQCHSKQDSSEDFSTQLWACAFQPQPDHCTDAAGGSRLVATCGGDSLCVIDCETGMVMKKYKVPGEEFFSLAWSTVLMSRGGKATAQHCSILAAGGKKGVVKLIHPRNNTAFANFRASQKALSVLHFNPRQGNFLFTGSYDNKIVMWDIGGVDSKYNINVLQLLVLEMTGTPLHICLPPAAPSTHLLAATEDGLRCYNTQLDANNSTKRSEEMEITFPIYKKEDGDHCYRTIDGLNFLTDDIVASKSHMQGSIYLWSWSRTKAQLRGRKSRALCAVLLAELQWAQTDVPYLALKTCPRQSYVVCGDDRGRLWTYHVPNLLSSSVQIDEAISPTEVLEWPNPVRKHHGQVEGPSINTVAMDSELRYLVALSDNNMVVVWKRMNESH